MTEPVEAFDTPFRAGQRVVASFGETGLPDTSGTVVGIKVRFASTPAMRQVRYKVRLDESIGTWFPFQEILLSAESLRLENEEELERDEG